MNVITDITLCDVDITPTNQLNDFSDRQDQKNYFASHAKHTYNKCKYQARSATIRVKGYVDSLINCNYGYYTNTYNGVEKTFYFWIVNKNFKARETTELTIQVDVFQTWLFDFRYNQCFIEREHVSDDTIGRNTIPEDFELGDYVTYIKKPCEWLINDPCFIVALTDTSSGTIGGIYGKTYSGFTLKYYKFADYGNINTLITDLCNNGKGDAIAFIFTFPDKLLNTDGSLTSGTNISGFDGIMNETTSISWNELIKNFCFNGYSWSPYNNKIYTHPFNFLTIKNSSGSNVVCKLELFQNINAMDFWVESVLTQNPIITFTPNNYDGKTFAIDDSISEDAYGLCSWNNDNYSNWFAQHQHSINAQSSNASIMRNAKQNVAENNYGNALNNRNINAEKGAVNTAMSTINALGSFNLLGAATNAIGGAANTYLNYEQGTANANNDLQNSTLMNDTNYETTINSIVASVQDAQVQPNTAKGSTTSCGLDVARNTATFYIEQTAIKPEYAQIIDMHWQMYGYKVNRVGLPNLNSRTKWNYIKTVGMNVYGEMPREDIDELNRLFDNGLRVWHGEQYMFQYFTDNPIVQE